MKVYVILKNPKEGKNTIHVRVRDGRAIDLSLATKENVYLEDWDEKNQCLFEEYTEVKNGKLITKRDFETKLKINENKEVNYRLFELKKKIETAYKSSNEKIDKEWLKSLVYPETIEVDDLSMPFTTYCDMFIESKGRSISRPYISKVKSIKAIVERYIHYHKLKQLNLIDINIDFKNKFDRYCLDIEKYAEGYVERSFKFIKTIAFHAQQQGYPINSGLERIKCRSVKSMFVILTPDELDLIKSKSFSDEHLETAKDWLLISCYCGQRVSDFMRFNTNMITEKDVKGEKIHFIEFTQEKTKKQMLLPLSQNIIDILKKRNWSFPRKMSEARYNEHIKKVCELVGINELVEGTLSIKEESDYIKNRKKNNRRNVQGIYPKYKLVRSHIGRRSFASNNFSTIPTSLLMTATGHSNINVLMTYIGKIDEQQSLALAEYLI